MSHTATSTGAQVLSFSRRSAELTPALRDLAEESAEPRVIRLADRPGWRFVEPWHRGRLVLMALAICASLGLAIAFGPSERPDVNPIYLEE
jgi:hypothetical protein